MAMGDPNLLPLASIYNIYKYSTHAYRTKQQCFSQLFHIKVDDSFCSYLLCILASSNFPKGRFFSHLMSYHTYTSYKYNIHRLQAQIHDCNTISGSILRIALGKKYRSVHYFNTFKTVKFLRSIDSKLFQQMCWTLFFRAIFCRNCVLLITDAVQIAEMKYLLMYREDKVLCLILSTQKRKLSRIFCLHTTRITFERINYPESSCSEFKMSDFHRMYSLNYALKLQRFSIIRVCHFCRMQI